MAIIYIYGGTIMFCTRCGGKNDDGAMFCSQCGSRMAAQNQPNQQSQQNNINYTNNIPNVSMARLIFKFDKNPLAFLMMNPLETTIDNIQKINVPPNKPIEYHIAPGHHRLKMSVPYMGMDSGLATTEFDVYGNETLEITYKPPMVTLMDGKILIRRI
jgi:hypothetical protein